VKLEGITATNPGSGEEIPVFIADYVLSGYGTGAIMAVPAHDERDFDFAVKYNIEVRQAIAKLINENETNDFDRTGVYGLIRNEKDEYLIQYFKNRNYYWLPGGGMEDSEAELECLQREIMEEAGFAATDILKSSKITTVFYDFISKHDGNKGRNKSIFYRLDVDSSKQSEVKMTQNEIDDGLEIHWVKRSDIFDFIKHGEPSRNQVIEQVLRQDVGVSHSDYGLLLNSREFDGLDSETAKTAIVKKVGGRMTSTYRLRDWSIGRQRYWGVPIPIVYDPQGKAHPVPEVHLPWLLPEDVDFRPTGEAPLAKSEALRMRTEEIFGPGWAPEVETMDTFVDSSWYFLRYLDNKNDTGLSSLDEQRNWMPVDIYFGGAEHTTMHLLYSRFWQKALFDLGLVSESEPYKKRINRGLILGPDGNKMSKSKGNVIDPDEQVKNVGADTVKMYLAFMGPYEGANYPFDLGGIAGIRRFLERVNGLSEHIVQTEPRETTRLLHETVIKVSSDIEQYKFNTAISALMIFINQAEKSGLNASTHETFIRVLAPFAPHLCEEIWHQIGHSESVHKASYPVGDPGMAKRDTVTLGVQINGKMRGRIDTTPDATEEAVLQVAQTEPSLVKYLAYQSIKKVIYIPGRILNIITD